MTKAAAHFGKDLSNFMRSPDTALYMETLEHSVKTTVCIAKRGGAPGNAGTWAHPKLAVFFARWLDVRFAVWCDMQIDDILHGLQANRGIALGRSVVVPAQQAQAPVVTITMEQVNEAIRAAIAPLEQRIAGLLHLLAAPPSAVSVKHCLQRSRATPLQRICPAVHQKPAKATTTP